jgi:hypothetical protein
LGGELCNSAEQERGERKRQAHGAGLSFL